MTVYASVQITLKNSNTYDHVQLFCTQEWNNERMKIKSDQTAMIFEPVYLLSKKRSVYS